MGKGTIGINPFYHDGTIMSHGAMAGLLSVIISFTDAKSCKFSFFSFLLLPSRVLASAFRLPRYAFRLGGEGWKWVTLYEGSLDMGPESAVQPQLVFFMSRRYPLCLLVSRLSPLI